MIGVFFGHPPCGLRPFIADAVENLPYFRADCVEQLAVIFDQLWPNGVSSTMLIYNELEPMSDAEKREAGIPRDRMPRAIWATLTAAGRAEPRHAATVLALRIIACVQRARFDLQEAGWSTFCDRVQFRARAMPEDHCRHALELADLVVRREERFSLPLQDCDKEWCPCRWDWAFD